MEPLLSVPRDFGAFCRAAATPLVALAIFYAFAAMLGLLAVLTLGDEAELPDLDSEPWVVVVSLLLWLLNLAALTIFCVSWMRRRLLGAETFEPPLLPHWDQAHWGFIKLAIGFSVAWFVCGTAVILIVVFALDLPMEALESPDALESDLDGVFLYLGAVLLSTLLLAWAALRFSPMFPAVVVGRPLRIAEAWQATSGISLQILAAAIVLGVLLSLVWMIGGLIVLTPLNMLAALAFGPAMAILPSILLMVLFSLVYTAAFLSQICLIYKHTIGNTPYRQELA